MQGVAASKAADKEQDRQLVVQQQPRYQCSKEHGHGRRVNFCNRARVLDDSRGNQAQGCVRHDNHEVNRCNIRPESTRLHRASSSRYGRRGEQVGNSIEENTKHVELHVLQMDRFLGKLLLHHIFREYGRERGKGAEQDHEHECLDRDGETQPFLQIHLRDRCRQKQNSQ